MDFSKAILVMYFFALKVIASLGFQSEAILALLEELQAKIWGNDDDIETEGE